MVLRNYYFFTIARLFRQTIFLPVMLLNAETWFNISQKNIDDLESMDKNLLRKILDAPSKTPIVSLYLELGCIPVRYLIKYKRIMYLHHILTRDDSHLLSKVFAAQMSSPSKEDLEELGLSFITFEDIQGMKKTQI